MNFSYYDHLMRLVIKDQVAESFATLGCGTSWTSNVPAATETKLPKAGALSGNNRARHSSFSKVPQNNREKRRPSGE